MSDDPAPAFGSDGNVNSDVVDPHDGEATLDKAPACCSAPGAMIGAYRLLEIVGEGGMGEVWLAEQRHPVRRRVAVKLIKAGMDTREVVARFESERQALALMDHPAIAKVFDAGSTSECRPYFVMEYVTGIPITTYCDKHKLTTRERLDLFIHVCDGVQHAHQKAIIHRDLKPSNILVTQVDGKPVPKIIDFGVAKAISKRLAGETMLTRAGAILGTPEYMSPEQAASAGEDIDTRSDVYSLGVVLYELLVGTLPLDLRKLSFDEMIRKLRDEDTPRPSTKVRTLGDQSTVCAQNRRTEADTLRRQLRGDLDAITLKALEKERPRRYGNPSEMAADIQRHLRNEPVLARPASVTYQARKYARRHRLGVAVAAGLVLLLAGFAVVQALQLRRITRERDRADRITSFITGMFKVSDPSEARGNKVTAREILDKASRDIGTGLANDPELRAQMMHVMGTVYDNLGIYSQAEFLLARSLEIRRRVLGQEHADTMTSMNNLANVLDEEGHYPEAEKLYSEALAIERRLLGPEHSNTLKSMTNLGIILSEQGHYREAEKLDRETLDIQRRVLGPEHPHTLITMSNLAVVLDEEGDHAKSGKLFRETLDIQRRVLGREHPNTLNSMSDLAVILDEQRSYPEAEKLNREVLEIKQRVLGPQHPETLNSMSNLGSTLTHMGQYAEAEKLEHQARDIERRVLGPEHPRTAEATYYLARIAARKGQPDDALSLLHDAIEHGLSQDGLLGIQDDSDLNSLHGNPRFETLVADAHRRAAPEAKAH